MPGAESGDPDTVARRLVARAEVDDPRITGIMRQVVAEQGIRVVLDSNRWAGSGYRGINVRMALGERRFEVQFHTPDSYEAAQATRGHYEERRLVETPSARRDELGDLIEAIFSRARVPPGVLS